MKNKKTNFQISVKNILACLLIAMFGILSISCENGDDENNSENENSIEVPTAGTANIILTAGGQEFKIVGPCGWASALGTNYIGANHADNNLRTFSSYFNIEQLPTATTTYTLVEDSNDTDPAHITMSISELSGSTLTQWSSKTTSGTLTLVVEGNKVTANLTEITLYPYQGNVIFPTGNTGAFANNGALTGTLTFYRQ